MKHSFSRPFIIAAAATAFVLLCSACSEKTKSLEDKRLDMVREQLIRRGVGDEKILRAFSTVPREIFVLPQYADSSYDDVETPMATGETLNRPYEDAMLMGALSIEPDDKVLEIGTGTGYLTSLLSMIGGKIYTIEIEPEYAQRAAQNFHRLGLSNVELRVGDGFAGWKEHAPFDRIVLNCSPPSIPEPLVEQLAEDGLLLLPLGGSERFQELVLHQKKDGRLNMIRKLAPASFTPMKGRVLEK